MSKKRLVTTGVIIALTLVLLIGGMLAFFTDTDTKTNVFTVGDNVEIEVTEVWNPEDGQNIHPGAVVTKEPSIKNNSTTTPAYVFIEVTVPCYASTGTTADRPLYTFTAKEGWELINTPEVDTSTKTITYVYSYSTSGTMTELTPDTTTNTPVFDHVTVEPTLTKEQKDTVSATPDIIINGYGIQTDYLGTSNPAEIFNTIKQEQEAQEGEGGSGNNETTNTVSNETTNTVSNETTNTTTNETQGGGSETSGGLTGVDFGEKTASTIGVGEDLTIGTEQFRVLSKSETQIVAVPFYNITLVTPEDNDGAYPVQDKDLWAPKYFSTEVYWEKAEDAIDMTDSRNLIQKYITAYGTKMSNATNGKVTARIARRSEMNASGVTNEIRNPGSGGYRVGSSNQYSAEVLLSIDSNGNFFDQPRYNQAVGVRPVIVIDIT